ncbi:hypothetical protein AAZX31_06G026100 [Glycine max]
MGFFFSFLVDFCFIFSSLSPHLIASSSFTFLFLLLPLWRPTRFSFSFRREPLFSLLELCHNPPPPASISIFCLFILLASSSSPSYCFFICSPSICFFGFFSFCWFRVLLLGRESNLFFFFNNV